MLHGDPVQPGRLPGGVITRKGGAEASERKWEGGPTWMSDTHTPGTPQRDGDLRSKPSSQAWRPSSLRGTLSASIVTEFPARRLQPAGGTAPAAHLASFDLLHSLPTSQVGPPGIGQAHEPFLRCPTTLPFPCHLPALLRSLGF